MDSDVKKLWSDIINQLKNEIEEESFDSLFGNKTSIYRVDNNIVYILVDNDFVKTRLSVYHSEKINEIAASLFQETPLSFKFITETDLEYEKEKESPAVFETDSYFDSKLNPKYTFSNFVVGVSNSFAYRCAISVAEQPASTGNPFYISGAVGVGKTHLMHAIGNEMIKNNPNLKVLYIPASTFVEEFTSVFYGTDKTNRMQQFNKKFKSLDCLLIDDIQMISGAEKTQNEFFKLYEHLHNSNKQIVLASDRKTSELQNIHSRLVSRFAWGLTASIEVPNDEHRVSILKRKAGEMFAPETACQIGEDILTYIAKVIKTNVRDLEGALYSSIMNCTMSNIPINLENVKEAIRVLINAQTETFVPKASVEKEVNNIISVVAKYYELQPFDILSLKKSYKVVTARHICMYLIRQHYNLVFTKIAKLFNRKDHTTVISAVEKIQKEINEQVELKKAIEDIEKKLGILK